jgi:hypothetical protein
MELSQEVSCVDFVMCEYTWVHRTHACTNFAGNFVCTNLASKSVCTVFASKFVYFFWSVDGSDGVVVHGPSLYVITMELSQEVSCVDFVMCIYVHGFT